MGITDISADYRRLIIKFINKGEYDYVPEFKELAIVHMKKWQEWVDANAKLMEYGPWKMIFMFPWFLKLNGDIGRLYSELNQTQRDLQSWGIENMGKLEKLEHIRVAATLTRETPIH